MQVFKDFRINGLHFTYEIDVEGDLLPEVEIKTQVHTDIQNTLLIHLVIGRQGDTAFKLNQVSLRWSVPVTDVHGFVGPGIKPEEIVKLPYWHFEKRSASHTNIPFVALINRNNHNRYSFGLLDQITETVLDVELSEKTQCYHFNWTKPDVPKQTIVTEHWEDTLFVSDANCNWTDVLQSYVKIVDEYWNLSKFPVPDSAYEPVFCTWTAIHHDVSEEWILHNAKIASDLGFKTWITDDGWFTDQGSFADYRYTGDWQSCDTKFSNFREHVKKVQQLGMCYILWVSPFMIGDASQAAQKYSHLLTGKVERLNFSNLSPWHEETKQIIGDLLERLVTDYGLDGFKLDFIDSIKFDAERKMGASNQTLGKAVYTTLESVIEQLRQLKPDILIEFRNTYANLASRHYANIYRSSDVPINFILNRWQVTMLRLLTPDRAIHFDPALWHPEDSDENVAVHLINSIISVPMVSIDLDRYPQNHHQLIRYWIGFYQEHKNSIIHGAFKPEFIFGHVAVIHFIGKDEQIIGLYSDVPLSIEQNALPMWILNASNRPYIELRANDFRGEHLVSTRDKFGNLIKTETVTFPCLCLEVEVGGSLEIVSNTE